MDFRRLLRSSFIRYGMVGGLGTLLHFGILILLVESIKMTAVVSSVIGFIIVLAVSYYLNRYWTFSTRIMESHWRNFMKYCVVSLFGLLLNTAIMYVTVELWHIRYLIGQAIVILVVPASNYLLNRSWTFTPQQTTTRTYD
ncbi:GtrA family protein [Cohnella silvisoli]|uniref:GtrA family protein n=1 Tax=Cohnella silvisoli TaxID=2873699 RepID=A0ABV1KZT5_9BACL|nr:GtrA family protein [Cohnella silvisoli]MCD9024484.1 GtrA family protein [Cohnella silvisoli]